jgi:hypothetical protein
LLPTFNWNLLVKILILISRSSIWFALAWNRIELTKNMLSWKLSLSL